MPVLKDHHDLQYLGAIARVTIPPKYSSGCSVPVTMPVLLLLPPPLLIVPLLPLRLPPPLLLPPRLLLLLLLFLMLLLLLLSSSLLLLLSLLLSLLLLLLPHRQPQALLRVCQYVVVKVQWHRISIFRFFRLFSLFLQILSQ